MTTPPSGDTPPPHRLFRLDKEARAALSPAVLACLRVAEQAHEDRTRDKKDVCLPYVTHTMATMNILRASGIEEPITLGAALLHDALEQDSYARKPYALKYALNQAMIAEYEAHGLGEQQARMLSDAAAEKIVELVQELTNPQEQAEDKRFYQADKVQRMSPRAKRIKMADLSATLLDDILYEPNRAPETLRRMYDRALTVVKIAGEARPDLEHFFFRLYRHNRDILAGTKERPKNPQDFDVSRWLRQEKEIDGWINDPALDGRFQGIVSVRLDETGAVNAFRLAVDPQGNQASFRMPGNTNRLAYGIVEGLDLLDDEGRYLTRSNPPTIFNDRLLTRKMEPEQPVPAEQFLAAVQRAGKEALPEPFAEAIRKAARLKQGARSEPAGETPDAFDYWRQQIYRRAGTPSAGAEAAPQRA